MSKPSVHVAALAFEIAPGGVATEAHLLPSGEFRADDGRPYDTDMWRLDAAIAAQVIDRLRQRKNDTLIDYEHQSLRSEYNGQPVIAAGWFHDMEFRDGKGLYATRIAWTDNAKQRITDNEYRYISAVFFYYVGTGEVLDIVSVALTNTPAVDGLDALGGDVAALAKKYHIHDDSLEDDMARPEEELVALKTTNAALQQNMAELQGKLSGMTVECADLRTKIGALTTERDELKTKLVAVEAAALVQRRDDLIVAALTDGRLTPGQKAWAEKLSVEALTEFLDATAPSPLTKLQHGQRKDGTVALDDSTAIAAAAKTYQIQQAALGVAVSVIDAVEHVMGGRNG
ncbi:MAG: hypothetical protein CTY21_09485 [Methylomonas sp.]|nr:MAG: hypothetical protein CTY21_09485 [Methylomonas sp.]